MCRTRVRQKHVYVNSSRNRQSVIEFVCSKIAEHAFKNNVDGGTK